MLQKLERILRTEQIGSPLHAWASAQIKELVNPRQFQQNT